MRRRRSSRSAARCSRSADDDRGRSRRVGVWRTPVRFNEQVAPPHAVMPGLGPRLSGSAAPASRETPAGMGSMVSLALPRHGSDVIAAHSLVMPGLGPGIHELLGTARTKAPESRDECGSSPRSPQGELVDARVKPRAKPWHDEGVCGGAVDSVSRQRERHERTHSEPPSLRGSSRGTLLRIVPERGRRAIVEHRLPRWPICCAWRICRRASAA